VGDNNDWGDNKSYVETGATLSGDATIHAKATPGVIQIKGYLAPGNNIIDGVHNNFGGIGSFIITCDTNSYGPSVLFGSTSVLCFDLENPNLAPGVGYDVFKQFAGSFGPGSGHEGSTLTFELGAKVLLCGDFVPGTYHIIQLDSLSGGNYVNVIGANLLDVDRVNSPSGFTYDLVPILGGPGNSRVLGIDLVVDIDPAGSGVPEPASLGLLGLGCMGLLLRRKR